MVRATAVPSDEPRLERQLDTGDSPCCLREGGLQVHAWCRPRFRSTETRLVLLVFLAVLGGVIWYLWWRADAGESSQLSGSRRYVNRIGSEEENARCQRGFASPALSSSVAPQHARLLPRP